MQRDDVVTYQKIVSAWKIYALRDCGMDAVGR